MSKIDGILKKQRNDYSSGIERNIPFNSEDLVTYETTNENPLSRIPAKVFSDDTRADKLEYIKEIQKDKLGKVFEKPRLSDEWLDFVQSRLKEHENLDFERFILEYLPRDDVGAQQILQQEFPEIIRIREETIDKYTEFLQRLVEISLREPQTRDDFYLMYNIRKGNIKIPPGILGSLFNINMEGDEISRDIDVGRGIYNPRRFRRLAKVRPEISIPNVPFPFYIDVSGNIVPTKTSGEQRSIVSSDPMQNLKNKMLN